MDVQTLLKQDWEFDPEDPSFKSTDITENDLNQEEIEEEEQRKLLISKIKNRKENPLNPTLFEDNILKDFIESELLLDEELKKPMNEIITDVTGKSKIARQFEYYKTEKERLQFKLRSLTVDDNLFKKAIKELLKFEKENEKNELIESNNFITLTLVLDFPVRETHDYIRVPIEYSLFSTTGQMDIFVVVSDEKVEEYQKILEDNYKLGEFEVVSATDFYKLYQSYVQKIRLLNSYDAFFHDNTLDEERVKAYLGAKFRSKKKFPQVFDSENGASNLLDIVNSSYKSTILSLEKGHTSIEIKIGRTNMREIDIHENLRIVLKKAPMPTDVVKMFLKTSNSPALCIFAGNPKPFYVTKQFKKEKSFVPTEKEEEILTPFKKTREEPKDVEKKTDDVPVLKKVDKIVKQKKMTEKKKQPKVSAVVQQETVEVPAATKTTVAVSTEKKKKKKKKKKE
eukprot:gene3908-7121_t